MYKIIKCENDKILTTTKSLQEAESLISDLSKNENKPIFYRIEKEIILLKKRVIRKKGHIIDFFLNIEEVNNLRLVNV